MIKRGKITLLDSIEVDRRLSKFSDVKNTTFSDVTMSDSSGISNFIINNNTPRGDDHLSYLEYLYSNAPTIALRFKIWVFKVLYTKTFEVRPEKRAKITLEHLQKFFNEIKTNSKELDTSEIEEILKKYETVLENAVNNNQTALIEKINAYSTILKNELILSESKFNKYFTEEDIVKFYNVASKHEKLHTSLCLTYVKNFAKIIPEDVTNLKHEADKLKVFDNYVILHYDYDGKAVEETNEEKAKKKDPVMFGIIRGSRNLYYIGDWIDEYCDLTLAAIIKKIGKKSVKTIDKKQIEKNIDSI